MSPVLAGVYRCRLVGLKATKNRMLALTNMSLGAVEPQFRVWAVHKSPRSLWYSGRKLLCKGFPVLTVRILVLDDGVEMSVRTIMRRFF
jgi:hypothetical protein